MYAHPSFVRDQPETLSHLRKLTTTSSRRRSRETPSSGGLNKGNTILASVTRSVSPSPSQTMVIVTTKPKFPTPLPRLIGNTVTTSFYSSPRSSTMEAPVHHQVVPASPERRGHATLSFTDQVAPAPQSVGRGRLDLLAMAMEQAAAMH